ncbi:fumarate reductase subunit C [Couchioplanes caeruleus]|uniref:Fumarate reductase n=3 Tax=Couchioplanes caeruleus TaxID=56438 RepID=A0A1K0FCW7_9ACTN|nr:fumarate reductase subunit C [Couchioplanes caeruleus]OJF10677.1 fumarate reductase [Couchioplanes caeruleus subsp. caeruleus]ROP29340.1 fumarate reductase subunit C [Couchioplanes caeruleus]
MISPWEARYYRRRMPRWWWARRRSYTTFVLRELSSVFVALFVVELLLLVRSVAHGAGAYENFLGTMANPAVIALNLVALAFVLLHAVTFANLTPRAMVVRVRDRTVPSRVVLAGVYLGWLGVTGFLAWLVVG